MICINILYTTTNYEKHSIPNNPLNHHQPRRARASSRIAELKIARTFRARDVDARRRDERRTPRHGLRQMLKIPAEVDIFSNSFRVFIVMRARARSHIFWVVPFFSFVFFCWHTDQASQPV